MRRCVVLFSALVILSGCAKVSHVNELLTLKGLADEQEQMSQYIDAQDKKFARMVDELNAGTLDQYVNQKKFLRAFGDPVYKKDMYKDGRALQAWLYRYATRYFDSEKIYLYFDSDKNLVELQYVEAPDGKVR